MNKDLNKTVGQRIKLCLEYRGESQREFAERLGKSPASICRYINGSRNVRVLDLAQFATALGVDVAFLMGESDNKALLKLCDRAARKAAFLEKPIEDNLESICEGFELVKEGLISVRNISKQSTVPYRKLLDWYKAFLANGQRGIINLQPKKRGRPRKKPIDILETM